MESLLLINPRRKFKKRRRAAVRRRRASNPRRTRSRRRHRVRGHVQRRRSGRTFRVRAHMSNPRRSHRRARRRRHMFGNPRLNLRGIVRETLIPAGIGAGGAVLTDVAFAYASPYLPAALTSGMLPVLVKLGVALGVGLVAGKVAGRRVGASVALGGVTVVAYGAIKGTLASALPTVKGLSGFQDFVDYSVDGTGARGGMGAYMGQPRLGFYSPAPVLSGGLGRAGAYMGPQPAPAMHGLNDANTGGAGWDWRNDGM